MSRAETSPAAPAGLDDALDDIRRAARRANALASAADRIAEGLPTEDRRGRERLVTMVRITVEEVHAAVDRVCGGRRARGGTVVLVGARITVE